MRVVINGEEQIVQDGISVADLVVALGLNRRRIAVELNQQIVAREAYEQRQLAADDALEIVTFVGGG
ncbi:MAG: sulfur carrier protein ThiS [Deltaproteobacteria bacterium]|nr:sulfur carrier protein ThiS [Deltaproteobacteria bacterium]